VGESVRTSEMNELARIQGHYALSTPAGRCPLIVKNNGCAKE